MSSGPWIRSPGILLSLKDRLKKLSAAELEVKRTQKVLRAYSNIPGVGARHIRATAAALHLSQQADMRLLKALKDVSFAARIFMDDLNE